FLRALCPATATACIYTLSLHDALPISAPTASRSVGSLGHRGAEVMKRLLDITLAGGALLLLLPLLIVLSLLIQFKMGSPVIFRQDRKSTRLNSSHVKISYAVFCLKKKK